MICFWRSRAKQIIPLLLSVVHQLIFSLSPHKPILLKKKLNHKMQTKGYHVPFFLLRSITCCSFSSARHHFSDGEIFQWNPKANPISFELIKLLRNASASAVPVHRADQQLSVSGGAPLPHQPHVQFMGDLVINSCRINVI